MIPTSHAFGARLGSVLAKMDRLADWEKRDRGPGSMRVDVEPTLDLLERLGQPQRTFQSMHVAGTKGKGSVCALVEAGLQRAKVRVARFSSPHVERVTKRVTFGGVEIGEELLAEALERSWTAHECASLAGSPAMDASWFDVFTAAALWSFAHAGVEWAVVECGIGGRLARTLPSF
ncbi:MAG: hypothetical protein M3Y41_00380 [Pseudomonadota bacterium]|nr:hypothetical protein [Pseudomonadota bacterium]